MASVDVYLVVKVLHILSATILLGTGIGTAFFYWSSRNADDSARLFAARTTMRADLIFTLPAVIIQPISGGYLAMRAGYDLTAPWLMASYGLYAIAGMCWLPVLWLQWQMRRMLEAKAGGDGFDERAFERLRRRWFALGWPAFGGLVAIIFLMVMKPQW